MKKIILIGSLLLMISCKKNNQNENLISTNETSVQKENPKEEKNNLDTIENNILTEYLNNGDEEKAADNFADYFYNEINNNKNTLQFSFNKLQSDTQIRIATSENKKFRVYSWDNNLGGTMRFFNQIFQFENNNSTLSILKKATSDPYGFVSKIFEVQNQNNETFYLVLTNSVFSTSLCYQSLDAYKIENNKLVDVSIFNTKKNKISSINFEFNFFSVVDRPERPVELITFTNDILKIPLINKDGDVTSQHLIYKWDKNTFNYEGVK